MNPDAADNRMDTLFWVKNMNQTEESRLQNITTDLRLPMPDERSVQNQTMWSIVQNYAEY